MDVSNCIALTYLNCDINSLTSLDVSGCTALTVLDCYYNSLTSLDVSNNTALLGLFCQYNSLTSLDVSQNTALTALNCYSNFFLTSLDVRNGNNSNMTLFAAGSTPSLFCISVDDPVYSNANWFNDAWTIFSNDCTVGIEDNEINQIAITGYGSTITIQGKGMVSIFNTVGKRVHSSKIHSGNNTISLIKGIYLVRIRSNDRQVTRKVFLSGN
ncbi:MAG: T9SS type A sorting domain-containing protein [Bacteroidetes bacterium]|nr:T9SS type A sorting domain-containing protein [Bacteroidota bacterium]